MFPVVEHLGAALEQIATTTPEVIDQLVCIEECPEFPGQLIFQPMGDAQVFLDRYRSWLSRYLILNEQFNLRHFVAELERDGFCPIFAPNTAPILADHQRWSAPLPIEGYDFHSFQAFSMNKALERARTGQDASSRFYFWNWSAGAGKSYCSGAGAKALLEAGDIDLIIGCTLSKLKENLRRTWANDANLAVIINDHPKPAERRERYGDGYGWSAFVMNYEKLWVDEEALSELTAGKRVLWVLDEGHKLIAESGQNKARKALDRLTAACGATVWPMSATVVGGNPLRFRDVFSLDGRPRSNPLGTKIDFVARYADSVRDIPIKTRRGGQFTFTVYDWSLPKLQEVRHHINDRAMAVRKTDPGVREQFKGIDCLPEIIQATDAAQELFSVITEHALIAREREETLAPYYLMLRIAAINPAALLHSSSEVAREIAKKHPALFDAKHSAKIEVLNDKLESIRESQDKAVVFCHWTELGLLPLAKHLTVPYVLHYGTGQSAKESQAAQDRFKADRDITCFASSDAGSHGISMQCARYVIQVDPVYSYDDFIQRASRIDRADSHLSGLTNYVLITEDSVEERIWSVCNRRRQLASAVQGTQETFGYGGTVRSEAENLDWLVFGK